jgi:signal transduction histidine kinase
VVLREQAANRVIIRVSDTGIGVAPEHLDDIFEPFWQVNAGQRSANGGTGLGLSVVRGLVRLLGGEVSVESAPGRGSTFSINLRNR